MLVKGPQDSDMNDDAPAPGVAGWLSAMILPKYAFVFLYRESK